MFCRARLLNRLPTIKPRLLRSRHLKAVPVTVAVVAVVGMVSEPLCKPSAPREEPTIEYSSAIALREYMDDEGTLRVQVRDLLVEIPYDVDVLDTEGSEAVSLGPLTFYSKDAAGVYQPVAVRCTYGFYTVHRLFDQYLTTDVLAPDRFCHCGRDTCAQPCGRCTL